MCGRGVFEAMIRKMNEAYGFAKFSKFDNNLPVSYNIAPSQPLLVVPNDGTNEADLYSFGWPETWKKNGPLINARAETIAEKPIFKGNFQHNRCLIFLSGYYEWQKMEDASKQPYYFHLTSHHPMAVAGLWKSFNAADDIQKKAVIVTTKANEKTRKIHNRMPVILTPSQAIKWISPKPFNPIELAPFLDPIPASEISFYPVSKKVNSPFNNEPGLLDPVEIDLQERLL